MNLMVFNLPENPAEWPGWLERQLVGLELAQLVVELQTMLPSGMDTAPELKNVCGLQLPTVLQEGLSGLSTEQLGTLLKYPTLLIELQEQILLHGGDYWQELELTSEHRDAVTANWDRLNTQLEPSIPSTKTATPAAPRTWMLVSTVVAAVAVVGVTVWLSSPVTPGWGFERGGLLTADVPADAYLNSLANAAEDWFNKQPASREALAARLTTFRRGCETLIASPHPQLTATDRDWLVERCQAWKTKLDKHLTDVDSGTRPLDEVQGEADATIRALITALRNRASSV